jgi:hypothetical protein
VGIGVFIGIWGVGIGVFIGIWGYKKEYLVKIGFILLEICNRREVQQKDFLRYLSISREIRVIYNIP